MTLTRTTFIRLIRYGSAALIIVLILAYATWRSLDYARGPKIEIFEPADGSSVVASTTIIRGRADRINALTLNGDSISIDEQGNFSQTIVVFPGVNIITLTAHDQFGRTTGSQIRLVGRTGTAL